jgi:hypothetical protein
VADQAVEQDVTRDERYFNRTAALVFVGQDSESRHA